MNTVCRKFVDLGKSQRGFVIPPLLIAAIIVAAIPLVASLISSPNKVIEQRSQAACSANVQGGWCTLGSGPDCDPNGCLFECRSDSRWYSTGGSCTPPTNSPPGPTCVPASSAGSASGAARTDSFFCNNLSCTAGPPLATRCDSSNDIDGAGWSANRAVTDPCDSRYTTVGADGRTYLNIGGQLKWCRCYAWQLDWYNASGALIGYDMGHAQASGAQCNPPTTTSTPTPTVTPTPTDTPVPNLCRGLSIEPTGTSYPVGTQLALTCRSNLTFNHANFRYRIEPATTYTSIGSATPAAQGNLMATYPNFTIPSQGTYITQCQICTTTADSVNTCTVWGESEMPVAQNTPPAP